jgi:hypothetical protein
MAKRITNLFYYIVTDAARTDVHVRVRRRVVPVRSARTGVRSLIPVAPEKHGVIAHVALSASLV